MAPSAVDYSTNTQVPGVKSQLMKSPIEPSGALDHFRYFNVTPVIGREYPTLNVVELIESPNADELIKELACISMVQHSIGLYLVLTTTVYSRCAWCRFSTQARQSYWRTSKALHPAPRRTLGQTRRIRCAYPPDSGHWSQSRRPATRRPGDHNDQFRCFQATFHHEDGGSRAIPQEAVF